MCIRDSTYTVVDFADASFAAQIENHVDKASGPVYDYTVDYLPDSGQFTFVRAGVTSAVNIPFYAAVAAVSILNDEIYSRVLADADRDMNRVAKKDELRPFIKVFGSDDHMDIKNFSKGDSKYNGVIGGIKTSPILTESGWTAVYNSYLAYAKGEHKFSTSHVNQESGYIGVGAVFSKDKFFIGSTANIAIMENRPNQTGDKNKFTSRLAGIAVKTGYNYDLGSDYILQPNLYGSYTYVRSNDYVTENQARVKFGGISNIELAPGVKLSKKFTDGLEIYVKGRYVFNFNEGHDARANGIILPDLELKNYTEVGIGIAKNWIDKDIDMFVEISRRQGGRDGWNGLVGTKWTF